APLQRLLEPVERRDGLDPDGAALVRGHPIRPSRSVLWWGFYWWSSAKYARDQSLVLLHLQALLDVSERGPRPRRDRGLVRVRAVRPQGDVRQELQFVGDRREDLVRAVPLRQRGTVCLLLATLRLDHGLDVLGVVGDCSVETRSLGQLMDQEIGRAHV